MSVHCSVLYGRANAETTNLDDFCSSFKHHKHGRSSRPASCKRPHNLQMCRPTSASVVADQDAEEELDEERYADLVHEDELDAADIPTASAGIWRSATWRGLLVLIRPLSCLHSPALHQYMPYSPDYFPPLCFPQGEQHRSVCMQMQQPWSMVAVIRQWD